MAHAPKFQLCVFDCPKRSNCPIILFFNRLRVGHIINYVFEDCPTVPKFRRRIGTLFLWDTFQFCRLFHNNMLNILLLGHLGQCFGTKVMKQSLLPEEGQEHNILDAPCLEEFFWI